MLRAAVLLTILTLFGSGCAASQSAQEPRAAIARPADCVQPARPALPVLDGGDYFDSPENCAVLMLWRDTVISYAKAWENYGRCVRQQVQEGAR